MEAKAKLETLTTILNQEGDGSVQALSFTVVDGYTTFRAEFTIEHTDFVFHFYQTPETRLRQGYWKEGFAACLESVAMSFFGAGAPRLQATYVDDYELDSWWLRAYGFATVLEPAVRARAFLERLDAELDATMRT